MLQMLMLTNRPNQLLLRADEDTEDLIEVQLGHLYTET